MKRLSARQEAGAAHRQVLGSPPHEQEEALGPKTCHGEGPQAWAGLRKLTAMRFATVFHAPALLAVVWLSGARLSATEVTVFAAASLTDSLRELQVVYEKQTGVKIVLNLGASSTLARQIEEGAPADIFFSADEVKMDRLERQGMIVKATRQSRLSNSLVLIVAAAEGAPVRSPQDLAKTAIKRIALGDPKAVPAGVYARAYFERLGLWKTVSPKVVITENVRAALAAVEAGDAEAGIVYKTDARISKKIRVAFEVPPTEGPKISYPMALLKQARSPEAAEKLLAFLASESAANVFAKYGFLTER